MSNYSSKVPTYLVGYPDKTLTEFKLPSFAIQYMELMLIDLQSILFSTNNVEDISFYLNLVPWVLRPFG